MGTRSVIAVKQDGKYKVAQYCQWDGYRDGQGADILDFLSEYKLDEIKKLKTHFLTDDDLEKIGDDFDPSGKHYHLSRDCGSDVLREVMKHENLGLKNCLDYESQDELIQDMGALIEFSYVIDLDSVSFHVYLGLPIGKPDDSYDLKNMPSKEEFISDGYDQDEG